MEKLIITAAITGSRITREATPYIPITPEEIVTSAIECWEAGAAIVHIHVRDPNTGLGTQDIKIFRQVVAPLRERTDLVLCLTTSGIPGRNLTIEERLTPLELESELASFDAGSINLGGSVFINTPEFLQTAAIRMREGGEAGARDIRRGDDGQLSAHEGGGLPHRSASLPVRARHSLGYPCYPEIPAPPP